MEYDQATEHPEPLKGSRLVRDPADRKGLLTHGALLTRVMIVDDFPALREGLGSILERLGGFLIVGQTGEGRTALDLVALSHPEVLILDLLLPDLDGIAVARQMRDRFPDVGVLAISGQNPPGGPAKLQEAGITRFLLKTAGPLEYAAMVRAIARERSASRCTLGEESESAERPTSRELAVLRQVAEGLRNREVAERLAVTERTVEYHLTNVLGKLDASCRTQAVRLAREKGWIE